MIWESGLSKSERVPVRCSRHPAWPNLHVLPYVRGRLTFAWLAARLLTQERFDCVAADLPQFLGDMDQLRAVLRLFPLVSSLLIRKRSEEFVLLPLAPSDAACIAAWLTAGRSGEFHCVDDPSCLFYPENHVFEPDLQLQDDSFAAGNPEAYFGPAWERMDALWPRAPYMQRSFTMARAAKVLEYLEEPLWRGKKVLLVCEFRLWWALRKRLEERDRLLEIIPATVRWKDRAAALVIEDPYDLWARGLFDDYPRVNHLFFQSLEEGKVESFNKLEALEAELREFMSAKSLAEAGNPSVRSLITLRRYLQATVAASRRACPLPGSQLFAGARECVSQEFAAALSKALLKYPLPATMGGAPSAVFVKLSARACILGGGGFDPPDVFHCDPYYRASASETRQFFPSQEEEERRQWADLARPHITRGEEAELRDGETGGIRWAVKRDYGLHEAACARVREIVRRTQSAYRVRRSWGTLKDGIHWKATLSAMARGEQAIYVKERVSRNSRIGRLDEHTPIVFLFTDDMRNSSSFCVHDSNIVQRNIELQNRAEASRWQMPPDMVYSLFSTRTSTAKLGNVHIERDEVSSMAFLYTRGLMGVDRYEAINRRPARFQCRVPPMSDGDLLDFGLSERGLAWAIKYAQEAVIAVTCPGWKPSPRLEALARQRHVHILTVPLTALPPAMIQRLRYMHFTSTALKRHAGCDAIVGRFVN